MTFSSLSRIRLAHLALGVALATAGALTSGCRDAQIGAPRGLIWDEGTSSEGMGQVLKAMKPEGLRVLWWNVEYFRLNGVLASQQSAKARSEGPLAANLRHLIQSDAKPNVIALAEYEPASVPPKLLALLESEYAYRSFTPYNEAFLGRGVMVFSSEPFVEGVKHPLGWSHPDATHAQKEAFEDQWRSEQPEAVKSFDRNLRTYRFNSHGGEIVLAPVHFLENWHQLKKSQGGYATGKMMAWGKDTPVHHQALALRHVLQAEFGEHLERDALVMIGDFNLTKWCATYRTLSEDLSEGFYLAPITFPAFSAELRKKSPFDRIQVKIDHAFVNRGARFDAIEVLKLRGSDHYPVYAVVSAKE